ncbi:MAG: dTDP-4-dehydrorhamnose reductase [Kiritimatiellaceae bacterium]|nr:dTDP-4-dehydrorhamnose reductase [Kiritimatiellaceae bacterium]
MKIIVLGSKGQLGHCLADQLTVPSYDVFYASRLEIDISKFEETRKKISSIEPEVIINASAYTAVDQAEENESLANLVNHLAVKNLAQICEQQGSLLIHISTDYVFDGRSKHKYKEKDQTNPQCIYGQTKLSGELSIQSSDCNYIILRTSWLYSEYRNNFLKTVLGLAKEKEKLDIVDDQMGSPTYAQDLAIAVKDILGACSEENSLRRVYHYAGNIDCSWADFASDICAEAADIGLINNVPSVNRITSREFLTLAKRPKNSCLDSTSFKSAFGTTPSDYKKGVSATLGALKNKNED